MESVPVAYVPNEKVTKKEAEQQITIPPYEDDGVKYQKNSKTLKGGNSYQTNPQTPFTCSYTTGQFTGTVVNYLGQPPLGKRLYIKSMQVNTSITAVDLNSTFRLYCNGTGVSRILFEHALLRSEMVNFNFDTPLLVDIGIPAGGVIGWGAAAYISSGAATINQCSYNIQGWVE